MRKIKGMEIANSKTLTLTPKGWIVPSQSGHGSYLVYKDNGKNACTCPDYELRGCTCKHQYAIDFFVQKSTNVDGSTTITKAVKVTYPQDWAAYTKAQTSEIVFFDKLLADLCGGIAEPIQTFGRPKVSMKEGVYCCIEKVYSQLSSRRASSLFGKAQDRGDIGKAPCYNMVNIMLNKEDLTPVLNRLLAVSALPLKAVEKTYATDSSGFRTSQFNQYAVEKYGTKKHHQWIKAHILVGTKTNTIAAARITEENGADCPQFKPLVMEAHSNGFQIEELVADMGYLSRENYETAESIGAKAYIPYKCNSTARAGGCAVWKRMYHYFQLHHEEFLQHYHKRSNVETTFDMVKMKFGDKLKSKKFVAQKNELLCKLIAHNIVVLIHEMFELGIAPEFCSESPSLAKKVGGGN